MVSNCPKNSWLADESTAMANPRDQVLGLLVPIDTYSDYRDLHEDNDDDDHDDDDDDSDADENDGYLCAANALLSFGI